MRTGPVVLLLFLLLAAGCSAAPAQSAPAVPVAATASVVPSGFNGTDVAWLQLVIPMEDKALRLLDLAAERGSEPAVRRLAGQVRDSHRAELLDLHRILDRTGLPATNVHEGHDMPGMVTTDRFTLISSTTGPRFDSHFLQALKAHLAQTAHISRGEAQSGANAGTKALARSIASARGTELGELDQLSP
ncbi:DUF305 domain-containing protein [Nonomuraea rosea]|uniref:DUF305 domain-containing protein n=1 Tax=Nonomuraea rosea TaxID=638574 RepID=A0ABP6YN06_9ACTN